MARAGGRPETVRHVVADAAHFELFRALHEIAVAVGGVLDPLDLARIVVERAVALLGADASSVYVWEPTHETLQRLHSSETAEPRGVNSPAPFETKGAAGQAVKFGVPIQVPDYVNWPLASAQGLAIGVRAVLAVPLRVADRTTGALSVRFHRPQTCSAEQIEILTLLAAQVAPALEAARLYDHAQRQIRERELAEDALRDSELRKGAIVEAALDCIIAVDPAGCITEFNPAAERTFGYRRADVVGLPALPILIPAAVLAANGERLAQYLTHGTGRALNHRIEAILLRADGTEFPAELAIVRTQTGDRHSLIGFVRDITERTQAEAGLRHQTLHDDLTGLPNRLLLNDRLEQAIGAAAQAETPFALLLLDLDRFKDVNDTLGHQAGDALLRLIGGRLAGAMREVDTLARLGGDEFAILLPGIDQAGALSVAGRVLHMLAEPFELNGSSLDVGGSLGVALYPRHGEDAEVLLQRADVAMYVAKRAGGGHAVYEPTQDHHSPDRLAVHTELRLGIDRGELTLHYQPKFACGEGQLVGVEALVRWTHPRRGLVMPDEFIPLAEQTGLIAPLSRWVLEAAVRQCRVWQDLGRPIPIAVNLSMRDLHDVHLPETIEHLLARWRVPAHLRVEITESSLMADPERALAIVARLAALGVRIAIDDFGTGYSSLAYLKKLPVDELKIDRSFVSDMLGDASDRAIVRSTIDLAHNLGLRVVAEGVEDAATWQLLIQLGCDAAQGYHLGRPAPPTALPTWLGRSAGDVALAA